MKELLRQRALALGFDACHFASADPPGTGPSFLQWLRLGYHGEMRYLARNAAKRIAPQQVLPGVQSIITLAASYGASPSESKHVPCRGAATEVSGTGSFGGTNSCESLILGPRGTRPSAKSPAPPGQENLRENARCGPIVEHSPITAGRWIGFIARYARFDDYHQVLAAGLEQFTRELPQLGGEQVRSRWYVDTGPVLERDLAQRSGLGFIGKHTNLVSRHWGNWLWLGEVLTTLKLAPDPPEKNRCGSCQRCLAACPTGAIERPFVLDARRCISYLTIEFKGSIPIVLRPAMGNRIFGCDDCLAACPWNRFARRGFLAKAHARADLEAPALLELLHLDQAGFKRRFGGTPVERLKLRGLRRNVCVALGNVADASALPELAAVARDPDPIIAEHARWAAAQIQGQRLRASDPALGTVAHPQNF